MKTLATFVITSTLLIGTLEIGHCQKYNSIPNRPEICFYVGKLNEQLKIEYDEETYNQTGVIATGLYNNLVIMSSKANIFLDLEEQFKFMYNVIVSDTVSVENIRYLGVGNFIGESMYSGASIIISGSDFEKYKNDFETLREVAKIPDNVRFKYTSVPDLKKILNGFCFVVWHNGAWKGGNRDKRYEKTIIGCHKNLEKSSMKK